MSAAERSDESKAEVDWGRPIGGAAAIERVFVAPQFTAGPNPQLADVRSAPERDSSEGLVDQPLAVDVSAGKNEPLYRAHPYHTKVPYQAIVPYIRHYTRPGDVVLDGFCGSGMTGVAAQLAGVETAETDQSSASSSASSFDSSSSASKTSASATSASATSASKTRSGARRAILADLSPLAGLLAYHNNMPVDRAALREALRDVVERATGRVGWVYATMHGPSDEQLREAIRAVEAERDPREGSTAAWGEVEFTLWSDVFECPHCAAELVYHDLAVVPETGRVRSSFACPACGQSLRRRQLRRRWREEFDQRLEATVRQALRVPVRISYSIGGKRHEKAPDPFDRALLDALQRLEPPFPVPADRLPPGQESRRNDAIGLTHVHHYYPPVSLWALGALAQEIGQLPDRLRQAALLVHSAVNLYASWLRRFRAEKKGGGPLSGTLYVASLSTPLNALHSFARNAAMFDEAARTLERLPGQVRVSVQSATAPIAPPESVDYVFVDPPFGGNLMYAELNFLWEAWLGVFTNSRLEAVENSAVGKTPADYRELLTACFRRFHEALKPGRWMTVVFHHSHPHVWQSVQAGLRDAGFEIVDVRTLDKHQDSFKQINNPGAVKRDLVISTRKPLVTRAPASLSTPDVERAWRFVARRLSQLPADSDERRDFLLYDRMVADCLRRGFAVPLSAAEFYAGLRTRFVVVDGRFANADGVSRDVVPPDEVLQ